MTNSPTPTDTQVANLITRVMDTKSISLLALSEETGIPYPTLRRSIKAGRSLNIQEIAKIADALSVQPSTLLPDNFTADAA